MTTLSEYEAMTYKNTVATLEAIEQQISVCKHGVITDKIAVDKIKSALDDHKQREQAQMEMFNHKRKD